MNRKGVEKEAGILLKRHKIIAAPIPIEAIAAAEGIQIVRSIADWNESGFLLRRNDEALIGINSRNSQRRQRFTIAHELGHWHLHKGKPLIVDQSVMVNKRDDVSSQATDQEEIEANQFAAALLMPEQFVVHALQTQMAAGIGSREDIISSLAREFDVSIDAMGWRLTNLGRLST